MYTAGVILPRVQGLPPHSSRVCALGAASKDLISLQTWVQLSVAPEGAGQAGRVIMAFHSVRGHAVIPPACSTKQMWLKMSFHRRGGTVISVRKLALWFVFVLAGKWWESKLYKWAGDAVALAMARSHQSLTACASECSAPWAGPQKHDAYVWWPGPPRLARGLRAPGNGRKAAEMK